MNLMTAGETTGAKLDFIGIFWKPLPSRGFRDLSVIESLFLLIFED